MKNRRNQFGRVGVLMGGVSREREISLKSGNNVVEALNRQGCHVVPIDVVDDAKDRILLSLDEADIDLAFIALHGLLGEDGSIQSILENANIPYTGSGVKASQTAFKKDVTQKLLKKNNIKIPSYITLFEGDQISLKTIKSECGDFPIIVKPACEGSSIGISLVTFKDKLKEALEYAWQFDNLVLVEQYIRGRELTVSILGQQALPVVEICPKHHFFTYEAKYTKGLTDYIVPAKIPGTLTRELQHVALKAHSLIGCMDLSRVDFMLDCRGNFYVLEVNTIPGFTQTSLLPMAANEVGLNFDQLCLRLLDCAYGKKTKIKDISVH